MEQNQVIAYYGSPYTEEMGILGAHDLETVLDVLAQHAQVYDDLNGAVDVIPAVHLVYAVAKAKPTASGLYLQHVSQGDLEQIVETTRQRGMLLILDLQIGRSTAEAEVERALPYLRLPHVHLALDPEFAVPEGEVPGAHLGSLDAHDINRVQALLQGLVLEYDLPPKILLVHQFADSMITNSDGIERYPGVDLVIDMDGIGSAQMKRIKYESLAAREYAEHVGIKLFLEHDGGLMTEGQVVSLTPRPAVVIYQ